MNVMFLLCERISSKERVQQNRKFIFICYINAFLGFLFEHRISHMMILCDKVRLNIPKLAFDLESNICGHCFAQKLTSDTRDVPW